MRDVVVKAKAKMGKIPDTDLYLRLANEDDFDTKVDILQKAYPDIVYSRDKISLEANNIRRFFGELKSIDYFLSGLESNFFNLYFSKYEILFLQEVIGSLVNENYSRNYLSFKANALSKNFILENNMDLASFVMANQDSKYYRTLLPFLNENMHDENLIFLTSNALMKFYYRSLLKLSKKFPYKERKLLRSFLGEEINLANLEMLYRLKTYYDLNNSDIFNYLIEGGNSFKADRLKELSLLEKDEFLKVLEGSKYRNIFLNKNHIHKEIKKYELKIYKSEITKEDSDILYVISAMNIMFISVENIEALMELDDSFTNEERLEYLIVR